jgi:uncharacterized protein YjdB
MWTKAVPVLFTAGFLGACGGSGPTTPAEVTVLGYTIVQMGASPTAPPITGQVGTAISIGFLISERRSDGSSRPASGMTLGVTVTAGGGTVAGASSVTLTTAADGSALTTWLLGPIVGTQSIRATVSPSEFVDINATATAIPVASVSLALSPIVFRALDTVRATATPRDAAGTALTNRTVTWLSSSPSVATVNASGLVIGVTPGVATITASCEGVSASQLVTITPAPVASVTVSLPSNSIPLGDMQQAMATLRDAAGNPLAGRMITWSSASPAVAAISATGMITALALGTTSITATSEGQTGSAPLTVTPVPVASVVVTPAAVTLSAMGRGLQFSAVALDAHGNVLPDRTITWSSDNWYVLSTNSTGLVVGVAPGGPVRLTATSEGKTGLASVTVVTTPWMVVVDNLGTPRHSVASVAVPPNKFIELSVSCDRPPTDLVWDLTINNLGYVWPESDIQLTLSPAAPDDPHPAWSIGAQGSVSLTHADAAVIQTLLRNRTNATLRYRSSSGLVDVSFDLRGADGALTQVESACRAP